MWVIGHVLTWGIMLLFYEVLASYFGINYEFSVTLILSTLTSLTQYTLIWWMFGRNLKWWLSLSLIAWMLPPVLGFYVEPVTIINLIIFLLILYMPSTLIQVFLLIDYVRHSWIWLFANFIGSLTFVPFIEFANGDRTIILLGSAFYALITAFTLLLLFTKPKYAMRKQKSNP